jgi:hypothetical protein
MSLRLLLLILLLFSEVSLLVVLLRIYMNLFTPTA